MLLGEVVAASAAVGATRSRLAKVDALVTVLRDASVEAWPDEVTEVGVVVSWLSGVLPQRRVGVSWRSLATLPEPAAESTLTVRAVHDALTELAGVSGAGVVARRREIVATLFGAATREEQDWLRNLITGQVRQGALDGVMLVAIAKAADVPEAAVRRAVMLTGYAAPTAVAALTGGEPALAATGLVVGRPLRPMLAGSEPSVADAFAGLTRDDAAIVVDGKLDGIRIQVHKSGDSIRVFTRSLDEITERVPEVVEAAHAWPVSTAVLDGEAIALRPDGRPEAFQVTGSRTASSADVAALRERTPLTPMMFDVLHVDGRDLLDEPLSTRLTTLSEIVPPEQQVPRRHCTTLDEAESFFAELVDFGHEGVVMKSPDAPYAAGRRGAGWIKVKPRHTLDLVVLAVEWGSGRRRGTLSNIHLGARDPRTGGFVMLGKTFKGMTDEMLAWQTQRFTELAVERGDWVVTVRPEQVVEIAFDGLQRSSRYPGGVALRFARVLRYRDDKTAEQADTIDSVLRLAGHVGK